MPKPESLFDEKIVVPFGRHESDRRAEYPANEVLIGREKERAEFLNQLLTSGRRGSYLITGHRGSGKSSFVWNCLREYEEDVYTRYLQRNVGRAFLWDRLGLVAIALVLLLTGLLLSEFLAELLSQPRPRALAWVGAGMIGILLSYPFFAGVRALATAMDPMGREGTPVRRILATVIGLGIFAGLVLAAPAADPAIFASQILLMGGWVFMVVNLLAVSRTQFDVRAESPSGDLSETLRSLSEKARLRSYACTALAALPPVWLLFVDEFANRWMALTFSSITGNVLSALILLCSGQLFRTGVTYSHRSGTNAAARSVAAALTPASGHRRLSVALLLSLPAVFGLLLLDRPAYLVLLAPLAAAAANTLWSSVRRDEFPPRFHPRPRLLLLYKAVVLLAIAAHLLIPLLRSGVQAIEVTLEQPEGDATWVEQLITSLDRPPWIDEDMAKQAIPTTILQRVRDTPSLGQLRDGHPPWADDLLWLLLSTGLLSLIYVVEFSWAVRPFAIATQDLSLYDRSTQPLTRLSEARAAFRGFTRESFFWKIHSLWLPILQVPVNLGFDQLDQRLVIEAMLAGLRERFRRQFIHWSSLFTTVRRLLWLLLIALAALLAGDHWFGIPWNDDHLRQREYCREALTPGGKAHSSMLWMVCQLGGETALQALEWSPFEESWRPPKTRDTLPAPNLLQRLFRLTEPQLRIHVLDLRTYHLLVFLAFLSLTGLFARWWPTLPYKSLDQRMTEILDGLSSRLREESRPDRLTTWLNAIRGRETVHEKLGGPFDPRTVELGFLQLLCDLQDPAVQIPFGKTNRLSPPVPEIVFVFDELDKIGAGRVVSEPDEGPEATANEPLDQERRRSEALNRLFADLKNIVSSGEARFVFIGGRNLHDEWLADSSARRPLLTNIFRTEIYIPSLLADASLAASSVSGIELFVRRQLLRSREVQRTSVLKRLQPAFGFWLERLFAPSFVQIPAPHTDASRKDDWPTIEILSAHPGLLEVRQDDFINDFYSFLTYRSKGNVKRLVELVESFLRPAGRVLMYDSQAQARCPATEIVQCDHVLEFSDVDRYRLQLIAEIYELIRPMIERRKDLLDDKMPQAILYLADFLLKFHRRAFSWSNIERVDELVHIHRAPDLRSSLQEILRIWDDRYLHRIRNGMYDFRFTSDFARELEFVSRASEEELAALNFTLDESHFLKAIYLSRIEIMGEESGEDFVSGLAELYEFDEEYELARSYCRKALQALDSRFLRLVDWEFSPNSLHGVFRGVDGETLRTRLAWAISRIRVMLQIGMTFERSRDLEHAQVEYREARSLAQNAIAALRGDFDFGGPETPSGFLSSLKRLNLLFQPLFAEAWLTEKMGFSVDTAPAMVESELWEMREKLPFVRTQDFFQPSQIPNPFSIHHSNFALLFAELHNKAGDLLFYKGRQLPSLEQIEIWASMSESPIDGAEGYLLRAMYHYNVALHEIRRFNAYRRWSSGTKFGIPLAKGVNEPTLDLQQWSDYVLRAAAGSLADLADCLFSRLSLTRLIRSIIIRRDEAVVPDPAPPLWRLCRATRTEGGEAPASLDLAKLDRVFKKSYDHVVYWLDLPNRVPLGVEVAALPQDQNETNNAARKPSKPRAMLDERFQSWDEDGWGETLQDFLGGERKVGLSAWLGRVARLDESAQAAGQRAQVLQEGANFDDDRLTSGLLLSMASARMLKRGGYRAAAIQEYLRVATAVSTLLVWRLGLRHVFTRHHGDHGLRKALKPILGGRASEQSQDFFEALFALGTLALRKVDGLADTEGPRLPHLHPLAITTAAGLALAGIATRGRRGAFRESQLELDHILARWTGTPPWARATSHRFHLRELLSSSLQLRSFSRLNRLRGLRVLIDDLLLSQEDPSGSQAAPLVADFLSTLESFDNPYHFTPLEAGFTLSLATFALTDRPCYRVSFGKLELVERELFDKALLQLYESQQMYTMRRKHYEEISDLYYLYDDFNDRTTHFNHALQMGGTEVASFLIRCLHHLRNKWRDETKD